MFIASLVRRDRQPERHAAMRVGAILCLGLVVLTGCATLSEGECKTADWYQIGRQDGGNGFTRARLYKHREACAEYGIRPQSEPYYAGRKIGLQEYCTPRRGFEEGREGHPYRDVCPVAMEPAFLHAYRKGDVLHQVDSDIEDVHNDIDRKERRLDNDDTSHRERRALGRDLDALDDELRFLQNKRIFLETEYALGAPYAR